ncbi:uncharacterized protein [Nicotiana sylvestris]|uniref:uncharacterized protein n=1 Tax=Nicotiana sylvestris TaxID=4096 RepID=UPI00388C403E
MEDQVHRFMMGLEPYLLNDCMSVSLHPDMDISRIQMEENGSRVSETCEGGGSNDSIPNTEGLSPDSPDEAPKKRKVMQPRSDAWKHFEKYDDPSGAKRAKCNYCQKTYAAATKGTSSASSGNTTTTVSGYGSFLKRGTMRTKLEFEKHKEVTGGLGTKSELERYLAEDLEPETDDFKILKWLVMY